MEPESHRRDREALLAEHETIAGRVQSEVDALLEVAAAKRRAFLVEFVDRMRLDAGLDGERNRALRAVSAAGPAIEREHAQPRDGRPVGPESTEATRADSDRGIAA